MMEEGTAVRNRRFSGSGLSVTHPDAAGIDAGSAAHFVAAPADRDDEPVREFKSFTADLIELADWLERCGVKIVAMESAGVCQLPKGKKRSTNRNAPKFDLRQYFTSWLGLCSGTKISGGKVLSSASKRSANRAAQALKLAAANLRTSRSARGAYYRHMCARMDKPRAVTAAAHKPARLIYVMLTRGEEYVDQGQPYFAQRDRERVVRPLSKRARDLGLELVPAGAAQTTKIKSMTYDGVS